MSLRQQQEYLVCNRRFPFLTYYCVHSLIATNRIIKPNAAFEAAHSRSWNLKRHIAAKTADTFYPCLPFIVSIVYPIKLHCKAK